MAALFGCFLWTNASGPVLAQESESPESLSAGEALDGAAWRPAIAMHGDPALGADFRHLPYADPKARGGGALKLGATGKFDNLNPFTLGGTPVWFVRDLVVESLMARSMDEPFTLYGLLAEEIATPPDRSFVAFKLRKEARFSDGTPVTIDDVIWSMETLRDQGRPNHRGYYSQISKVERIGDRAVKFHFKKADRELPLLIGFMPVLSKKAWRAAAKDGVAFKDSGFYKLVGTGPYRIAKVEPARRVVFERNPDYWGAALPVNAGRYNLDRIDYRYFRDNTARWEAFKAGHIDLYQQTDPLRWKTLYDFPAMREGRLKRETAPIGRPSGMEGFVFNTRRAKFADRRVREAIALAFNYEWVNRSYFGGLMLPVKSYFGDSDLGFSNPASPEERALLGPYLAELPKGVLTDAWRPRAYRDVADHRRALVRARDLLAQAGWRMRDGALRNAQGDPFRFEILTEVKKREHERIARSFAENLEWLGVTASVRLVDGAQHTVRKRNYDYDMMIYRWGLSLSPGQEQCFYFGSSGRKEPGTRNYMGVASEAVDAMIDAILEAKDRESFETAVRAHDRVLSAGVYVIPWGWRNQDWLAMDAALQLPKPTPIYGFRPEVLWRRD